MRVISKFRDYYDNTGFYGEDRVWVRERQEYAINHARNNILIKIHFNTRTDKILGDALYHLPSIREIGCHKCPILSTDFMIVVGFCGRMYPAITHWRIDKNTDSINPQLHSVWFDVNEYKDMIDTLYKSKIKLSEYGSFLSDIKFTPRGMSEWEDRFNKRVNLQDVFIDLKTPLFILQRHSGLGVRGDTNLIINPCMKDYKLMSKFHPFTTHQDIDTYIGNDLAVCTLSDFKMSDELKRDSKGMDEWSFKQKGPKKRKIK